MGSLSIYQHKQDVFGWIYINGKPHGFLRRWGGCLAVPQRRWGPLGTVGASQHHCCYETIGMDSSLKKSWYAFPSLVLKSQTKVGHFVRYKKGVKENCRHANQN